MKKTITKLEKALKELRELVQTREDYYDERTEKWQESEKGDFYYGQTYDIEYKADELDCLIDELKEL